MFALFDVFTQPYVNTDMELRCSEFASDSKESIELPILSFPEMKLSDIFGITSRMLLLLPPIVLTYLTMSLLLLNSNMRLLFPMILALVVELI